MKKAAGSLGDPGRVLICFDFEAPYGTPYKDEPYDLAKNTRAILDELAKHDARAVFFVVGRMAEDHPDIVQAIADAGHEIGLHGYEHDNLGRYDAEGVQLLGKNLARVSSIIEDMSGSRPVAFRAPYLLWPNFYKSDIYKMLRDGGYRWVSNREVRYPYELLRPRPGKLPFPYAWRTSDGTPRLDGNRLLLAALNTKLLRRDTFYGSSTARLRWLIGKREPFTRDGMTEVPVMAPLDCDLIGLPHHDEDTPKVVLDYGRAVVRAAAAAPGQLTTITFHDWIVSRGNRLVMLGDALTAAREAGSVISTIADNPDWLPEVV